MAQNARHDARRQESRVAIRAVTAFLTLAVLALFTGTGQTACEDFGRSGLQQAGNDLHHLDSVLISADGPEFLSCAMFNGRDRTPFHCFEVQDNFEFRNPFSLKIVRVFCTGSFEVLSWTAAEGGLKERR
jgi:hypothetical protein